MIEDFIKKYLGKDFDALMWASTFLIYAHAVDDIIDGDKTDSDFILKTFGLAPILYGNIFYLRNISRLYPIVKMSHNCYRDSVVMEKSNSAWKRHYADVLRQMGNDVLLECIEILHDVDTRNQAAIELRELSYKAHHTKEGVPI